MEHPINHTKKMNILTVEDRSDLKCISISGIDLSDRCFCFRFFPEPPHILIDSVKRFGVTSPPLVRARGDTYQVLDGFRRLEAANICGIDKVYCRVCNESIDEPGLILPVLSVFLSSGPPHVPDQATILDRMSRLLSQDRIINDILPLLGYPPSPKVLARLLPLSKMDEELGKALLEGKISHDMALHLMEIEPQERKQIGSLFLYFCYSQSKQFEVFEYLNDICAKEKISITEVLAELGWGKDRENPSDENRAVSGEAFRQRLKARRFPTLTGLEGAWKNRIKALRLPPSVSLKPPPYFEGGTYRLSFSFKDINGFRERMAELTALEKKDAWIELFTK